MKIKLTDKKTIILIVTIVIVLALATQIAILYNSAKILKLAIAETEECVSVYASTPPMLSQDALYCLYECGGKIGIYDAKSNILIDMIDVFAASLPMSDRKALKQGIEVFSFSDLSDIIDDFTS